MSAIIERLAHFIGWTTLYHVAWTEPMSSGFRSGDMTITVRPWITSANWKTARDVIAADNGLGATEFVITSVTIL